MFGGRNLPKPQLYRLSGSKTKIGTIAQPLNPNDKVKTTDKPPIEILMSDADAKALNDLQQLFGGLAAQEASSDTSDAAASGGGVDEFGTLQDLLVKPEIRTMQEQLARLEEEIPDVQRVKEQIIEITTELPEIRRMQGRLAQLEDVLPEWETVKTRVSHLEETVPELLAVSDRLDQIEQHADVAIARLLMPLISQLLDQKLARLEANLNVQLEAIANRPSGGFPPEHLSFQVQALDPDAPLAMESD
ncbi:MAG: hypothetical protein F6J87_13130 [Spirulina sp. SIO3F2]|nr:hypothetical protein [Spirulina sp. SIO3F2]